MYAIKMIGILMLHSGAVDPVHSGGSGSSPQWWQWIQPYRHRTYTKQFI